MVQLLPGQAGGPSTAAQLFCTFVHAWLLHTLQSCMYVWQLGSAMQLSLSFLLAAVMMACACPGVRYVVVVVVVCCVPAGVRLVVVTVMLGVFVTGAGVDAARVMDAAGVVDTDVAALFTGADIIGAADAVTGAAFIGTADAIITGAGVVLIRLLGP